MELLVDENDVVKYEKTNLGTVVIFYTGGEFFGATMHSAFFMDEEINQMVGLQNKVRWMHDNYYNMYRPMMSFHLRQVYKLRDKIRVLGFEVRRDDGKFLIFDLKEKVEKARIDEWLNSEKLRREKLKKYLHPWGDFGLFRLSRELLQEVMTIRLKGMADAGNVLLAEIIRYVLEIHECAGVWEREWQGDASEQSQKALAREKIQRRVDRCSFVLSALVDRKVIDDGKVLRIGACLLEIRNEVDGKAKRKTA